MPRPKPDQPWRQVALRLTPGQVAKVQHVVDNSGGFTFTGAIRHMIEFYEPLTNEERERIMRGINARVARDPPMGRPKAAPGSLLKKR